MPAGFIIENCSLELYHLNEENDKDISYNVVPGFEPLAWLVIKWTPDAPPTTWQLLKNSSTSSAEADQGRPLAFTYLTSPVLPLSSVIPALCCALSLLGERGVSSLKVSTVQ